MEGNFSNKTYKLASILPSHVTIGYVRRDDLDIISYYKILGKGSYITHTRLGDYHSPSSHTLASMSRTCPNNLAYSLTNTCMHGISHGRTSTRTCMCVYVYVWVSWQRQLSVIYCCCFASLLLIFCCFYTPTNIRCTILYTQLSHIVVYIVK